uniref:Small EDRK-rich factor-like N-terminal domain-containing protein n=3 Tax=Balaenoptera TaxID=9766 RepID=A0A8C0CXY1_BALMU
PRLLGPSRAPPRPPGHARAVTRRPRRLLLSGLVGLGRPPSTGVSLLRVRAGLGFQIDGWGRPLSVRASRCFSESLFSRLGPVVSMARGNQRELARQKNMKKSQEISKGKRKEDSLSASQRKQRDSEIMQQKQKAANEKKSMQTREK